MGLPKNIVIVEDEVITQRYLQDILTNNHISRSQFHHNRNAGISTFSGLLC